MNCNWIPLTDQLIDFRVAWNQDLTLCGPARNEWWIGCYSNELI